MSHMTRKPRGRRASLLSHALETSLAQSHSRRKSSAIMEELQEIKRHSLGANNNERRHSIQVGGPGHHGGNMRRHSLIVRDLATTQPHANPNSLAVRRNTLTVSRGTVDTESEPEVEEENSNEEST